MVGLVVSLEKGELRFPGGFVPGFVAWLGQLVGVSPPELVLGMRVSSIPCGGNRWPLPRFVVCRDRCELVGEGRCRREDIRFPKTLVACP